MPQIPMNTVPMQPIKPSQAQYIVPQRQQMPAIAQSTQPAVVTQTEVSKPSAICWQCRSPIAGKVIGCPQCGARYCGSDSESCDISSVETCLSCQSPASTFIRE